MSIASVRVLPALGPAGRPRTIPPVPAEPVGEPAVHVLHDNPDWLPPFRRAFEAEGVPLVEVLLDEVTLDLDA